MYQIFINLYVPILNYMSIIRIMYQILKWYVPNIEMISPIWNDIPNIKIICPILNYVPNIKIICTKY